MAGFEVQGPSKSPRSPCLVFVCVISLPGFGALSGRYSFVAMELAQIEDFFSLKWGKPLDRHYGFWAIAHHLPFDALFIHNNSARSLNALLHCLFASVAQIAQGKLTMREYSRSRSNPQLERVTGRRAQPRLPGRI